MDQNTFTSFYVCIVKQESASGAFVCRLISSAPMKDDDIMSVLIAKATAAGWADDVPVICDIVEFDDGDMAQEFYDMHQRNGVQPTPQQMADFAKEIAKLESFTQVSAPFIDSAYRTIH